MSVCCFDPIGIDTKQHSLWGMHFNKHSSKETYYKLAVYTVVLWLGDKTLKIITVKEIFLDRNMKHGPYKVDITHSIFDRQHERPLTIRIDGITYIT